MNYPFILISILTFFNAHGVEILKPVSLEIKAPIIAYIQGHQKQFQEDLPTGGYEYLDMYVIDINNDGQNEYVFLEYTGTANALTLRILAKDNNEIQEIRFPNTFNYFHEFVHPLTHECQLFVKVNGIIYICFSRGTYDINLEVYCWKNGIVSPCCSPFWVKQQVQIFDELCIAQDYRAAYIFLNDFKKICKDSLDAQTDLHILSKIACAALHNNWLNQCMTLLTKIKTDKNYQSLSPALKDEISRIESLCQKKSKEEREGNISNSFKWMLAYENKSSGALIADKRFNLLLSSICPDLLVYDFFGFTETPENINRYFYWSNMHIFDNDEADKVFVTEQRYIAFSGCYPHCVCHRGFVWCDVQKSVGVLVLIINGFRDGEDKIYITSRQLEAKELPGAFFKSLQKWLKDNEVEAKQAKFCNRQGIVRYMTI